MLANNPLRNLLSDRANSAPTVSLQQVVFINLLRQHCTLLCSSPFTHTPPLPLEITCGSLFPTCSLELSSIFFYFALYPFCFASKGRYHCFILSLVRLDCLFYLVWDNANVLTRRRGQNGRFVGRLRQKYVVIVLETNLLSSL